MAAFYGVIITHAARRGRWYVPVGHAPLFETQEAAIEYGSHTYGGLTDLRWRLYTVPLADEEIRG